MVPRYMGFDIPLIEQNGGDEMGNCLQEIPVCVCGSELYNYWINIPYHVGRNCSLKYGFGWSRQ
jgi:hypothetical protein